MRSTSPSRLACQYSITHSLFRHDYDIISTNENGSERPSYHVNNSHLTPGKPDLTFHVGSDAKGPIAGVCKYRHFSSDAIIGLGDPSQSHSHRISWEHFTRESPLSSRYSFRVKLGSGRARTFTWRVSNRLSSSSSGDLSCSRSTSPSSVCSDTSTSTGSGSGSGSGSSYSSFGSLSGTSMEKSKLELELVHESSNQPIAELSSGTTFSKKAGQLNIYKSHGDQFDLLVLITGLALREKLRRSRPAPVPGQ